MMNHVYFELPGGAILRPHEDYGVLLKSYDVPPPEPKTNLVSIDGRDGDIDFSDWAGIVRFESRDVKVSLRDMQGNHDQIAALLNGRRVKLWFDDDPRWYYSGRVVSVDTKHYIRHRVCDIDIAVTCDPYRLSATPTVIGVDLSATAKSVTLAPKRKPVAPTLTTTGTCTLTADGTSETCAAGTHPLPTLTGPVTYSATGSGRATFTWTDGDF